MTVCYIAMDVEPHWGGGHRGARIFDGGRGPPAPPLKPPLHRNKLLYIVGLYRWVILIQYYMEYNLFSKKKTKTCFVTCSTTQLCRAIKIKAVFISDDIV